MRSSVMRILCTAAVLTLSVLGAAHAEHAGRDMEAEALIWKDLERRSAEAVDIFKAATEAMDHDQYKQAEQLFGAVLADRIAVVSYGAAAFEEGLTHAVRQGVAFDYAASEEIEAAMKAGRPISNLYELQKRTTGLTERRIEDTVSEALGRETTEDDTHPSPKDRIQFARRIDARAESGTAGLVWDLFANPEALIAEMNTKVSQQVDAAAAAQRQAEEAGES